MAVNKVCAVGSGFGVVLAITLAVAVSYVIICWLTDRFELPWIATMGFWMYSHYAFWWGVLPAVSYTGCSLWADLYPYCVDRRRRPAELQRLVNKLKG